ncbi:MAG TPA: HAD-IIIA family hydrolase [Thermopolyspora sp.]
MARVRAVLFDRDGTLIEDVPYNNDPVKVRPMPGAGAALDLLRLAGVRAGVVTNQSGVARGLVTPAQLARINHHRTCSAHSTCGRSVRTSRRTVAGAVSPSRV